jgi:hypothetical protein
MYWSTAEMRVSPSILLEGTRVVVDPDTHAQLVQDSLGNPPLQRAMLSFVRRESSPTNWADDNARREMTSSP